MPQGFDATRRFHRSNAVALLLLPILAWVPGCLAAFSMLRCLASILPYTRFDPFMLLLQSLATSIIASIARLTLSFVAWESIMVASILASTRFVDTHVDTRVWELDASML